MPELQPISGEAAHGLPSRKTGGFLSVVNTSVVNGVMERHYSSPIMTCYVSIRTVASLESVSPGAATDGVTLFFLEKKLSDDLFSHRLWKVMTFFSCRLLTTSIFPSSFIEYSF